ncbi:unnamed protein product [Mycena citricolor]|uniref:Uncharacterized protein n=1 Tax=Mycena citricolor TaxID=2018698 RepID=A0AAD2K758_9AGAR|nr:unnamed protein product [Mycena citricolor]
MSSPESKSLGTMNRVLSRGAYSDDLCCVFPCTYYWEAFPSIRAAINTLGTLVVFLCHWLSDSTLLKIVRSLRARSSPGDGK